MAAGRKSSCASERSVGGASLGREVERPVFFADLEP
jgi:hypothetical protein